MAYEAWVNTGTAWCERMKTDANMLEQRVYPAEIMPDLPRYQVKARKCSLAIACNLAGFPCKWAFAELGSDPF